jgi:CheY-like chemotaxis protein
METVPPKPLAGRTYELALRPGPTADRLARVLGDYGANVIRLDDKEAIAKSLSARRAGSTAGLIADVLVSEQLLAWKQAVESSRGRAKSVWTLLQPEERRQHRKMLEAPFAGYFIKPLRRATLLKHLAACDEDSMAQAARQLRNLVARVKPTRRLDILLAEDNPVNALLARTILQRAGHLVEHVTSGRLVLERMMNATLPRPDLIIMDVEMPDIDGIEAARRLRALEREQDMPSVPILALTANAQRDDEDECTSAGMNGYLLKPFDSDDLEKAISKLVARKAA